MDPVSKHTSSNHEQLRSKTAKDKLEEMRSSIVVMLAVLVSVMNCQTDEPDDECIANFLFNNLDVTLAAVRDCGKIVSKIWRKWMLHELANYNTRAKS